MLNAAAQTTAAKTAQPILAQPGTARRTGLPRATEVLTLAGVRHVEALRPGDRVITRGGAQILRGLTHLPGGYRLHFETPQVVLLSDGQVHSDSGEGFAA
jgi:predicted enzyme related to lactoylglutathione lyase